MVGESDLQFSASAAGLSTRLKRVRLRRGYPNFPFTMVQPKEIERCLPVALDFDSLLPEQMVAWTTD